MFVLQGATNSKWLEENHIFRPLFKRLQFRQLCISIENSERAVGYRGVACNHESTLFETVSVHKFNADTCQIEQGVVDATMLIA